MGEFTKGPVHYEPHIAGVSWHIGPATNLGPIGPMGEDLTGQYVAAIAKDHEANARLIAAAFNAATAVEALGYDGQEAIEKLPEMLMAVRDLAGALADEVNANYPSATRDQYPSEQRRWARDMSEVEDARAALPTRLAESE